MTESRHHPQKATNANKSYYYYAQRITHKKTEAFSGLLVTHVTVTHHQPVAADCPQKNIQRHLSPTLSKLVRKPIHQNQNKKKGVSKITHWTRLPLLKKQKPKRNKA